MTDILTTEGYTDAGYTYVNVDDCWLSHSRDKFGRLQADSQRFPSGMKALADYVRTLIALSTVAVPSLDQCDL